MPPSGAHPRELLDREIMLRCLADAADSGSDSDLCAGTPARRVLEARRRASRTLRLSARCNAESASLLAPPPAPERSRPAVPLAAGLQQLAPALLLLNLRRGQLAALCLEAAGLRSDAEALRAEARQIRRARRASR